MIVYHRTSCDAAIKIHETKTFTQKERADMAGIYVSDTRDGYTTGYGEAVVVLDVPESILIPEDEYPGGEMHYRINARDIKPEHFKE